MNNDLFVKAVIFLFNLGIIHHRQGVLHTQSVFRPLKNTIDPILVENTCEGKTTTTNQ